jgi:hypothetical protein
MDVASVKWTPAQRVKSILANDFKKPRGTSKQPARISVNLQTNFAHVTLQTKVGKSKCKIFSIVVTNNSYMDTGYFHL